MTAAVQAVFDLMAAGVFNTYVDPDTGDAIPLGMQWAYDSYGTIITHPCGVDSCLAEADYLLEEIQSPACSGSYSHKVSLVLDGGDINDGTFNQLAYEGALAACSEATMMESM